MKRFRVNKDGSKTLLSTSTARSGMIPTTRQSDGLCAEQLDVIEDKSRPNLSERREGSATSRSHVYRRYIKKSRQI